MSKGIVFYYSGSGYDPMVPPALYSLRKCYSGPVHIVCRNISKWFSKQAGSLPGFTMSAEPDNEYTFAGTKNWIWCRKAYHHQAEYPFDINLYFDIDHIFQRPMDNHPIFDKCEKAGMVACSSDQEPPHASRKMNELNIVLDIKLTKLVGTNGGCLCTKKGDPLIAELLRRIKLNITSKSHTLSGNPEEFAIASMYSEGIIAGETFESVSYPIGPPTFNRLPDLSNWNLHGTRGTLIRLKRFWDTYDKVLDENFMNAKDILTPEIRTRFEGYKKDAVD
jgi:hypothetical protein